MDLVSIANATIPAAEGKKEFKKDGDTADIIAEVLAAFRDSRGQLTYFAPHLKAATLPQTLYNVWHFWKSNIKYQVDPANQQWIQTPAALWASKSGDCKSLSLAVMCTLDVLNIKAAFRFATYRIENISPTHVYSVVSQGGKIIPVDCVWKEYGTEKSYSKKWDYNMTAIMRISGFDAPVTRMKRRLQAKAGNHLNIKAAGKLRHKMPVRGRLVIPEDNPRITHGVVDMLLKKQRLELEQKIHVSSTIGAIGDTYDRAFEMQIAGIHNALAEDMGWPRVKVAGFENPVHPDQRNDHAISGIACTHLQHEAETVAAIEGFFGKVFKGIGKGLKSVAKVVTAPAKLVFKGVKAAGKIIGKGAVALKNVAQKAITGGARAAIVDQLPQAAPMFLYLFITDPNLLAKLPAAVAAKRAKALEYKKIITGKLMLSESNFTGAVRNGIMLQFNMAPEALIAKFIQDTNFKVSGILDTALGAAGGLLKSILGNVGANLGEDAQTYAPAPEDWGTVAASAADLASSVVNQPGNLPPMTQDQLTAAMQQYTAQQARQAPAPAPAPVYNDPANGFELPEGAVDNGDGTFTADSGKIYPIPQGGTPEGLKAWPKTGKGLKDSKDTDNVTVDSKSSGNSTALLAMGGLALLLVMSGKPKK